MRPCLLSEEYRGVLGENFRFYFYFLCFYGSPKNVRKKNILLFITGGGGQGGFDKCQFFFFEGFPIEFVQCDAGMLAEQTKSVFN